VLTVSDVRVTNPDPLFSVTEAARYMGLGRSTMYDLVKREQIPLVCLTKDRKILKSTLDELIRARTSKPGEGRA
jgi:excisionase family DNA binding protein